MVNDINFLKFPVEWIKTEYPNNLKKQFDEVADYLGTVNRKLDDETLKIEGLERQLKMLDEELLEAKEARASAIAEKMAADGQKFTAEDELRRLRSRMAEPKAPAPQPPTSQSSTAIPAQQVTEADHPLNAAQEARVSRHYEEKYEHDQASWMQDAEKRHQEILVPYIAEVQRLEALVVVLQNSSTTAQKVKDLETENANLKLGNGHICPHPSIREWELQRDLLKCREEKEKSETKCKERTRDFTALNRYRTSTSKTIQALEDTLFDTEQAKSKANQTVADLSTQNSGLAESNRKMASNINTLKNEQRTAKKQHDNEISFLQDEHESRTIDLLEEHENQLSRLKEKHEKKVIRHKTSQKILLGEFAAAQTEIADLKDDKSFLEKHFDRLRDENCRLTQQLDNEIFIHQAINAKPTKETVQGWWSAATPGTMYLNAMAFLTFSLMLFAFFCYAPLLIYSAVSSSWSNTRLTPIKVGPVAPLLSAVNSPVSATSSLAAAAETPFSFALENDIESFDNYLSQLHRLAEEEDEVEVERIVKVEKMVKGRNWKITVGKVAIAIAVAGVVFWRLTA